MARPKDSKSFAANQIRWGENTAKAPEDQYSHARHHDLVFGQSAQSQADAQHDPPADAARGVGLPASHRAAHRQRDQHDLVVIEVQPAVVEGDAQARQQGNHRIGAAAQFAQHAPEQGKGPQARAPMATATTSATADACSSPIPGCAPR
ncbi:hypothetical protein G6F22_018867 [Rhizopus arrhizus]|nr:hypothetical protein G6F22_018867 [Rhizopus arrhizus]